MNAEFLRIAERLKETPRSEGEELIKLEQQTAEDLTGLARIICAKFPKQKPGYGFILFPDSALINSDFAQPIKDFLFFESHAKPVRFMAIYAEQTQTKNYSAIHLAIIKQSGEYVSSLVATATGIDPREIAVNVSSYDRTAEHVFGLQQWMNAQINVPEDPEQDCFNHVALAGEILSFGYLQLAQK